MKMMEKFLVFLGTIIFIFGAVGTANALLLEDTTVFDVAGAWDSVTAENDLGTLNLYGNAGYGWGAVNNLGGTGDYVDWTHNYVFDPSAYKILSGKLIVTLEDNETDNRWWKKEYAFGWAEDGTWDWGEVDTGDYSCSVTTSFLEDGEFGVTLFSAFGDFRIVQAKLEIDATPIPEPTTLLLLGSGLVGMISIKKRFSNIS